MTGIHKRLTGGILSIPLVLALSACGGTSKDAGSNGGASGHAHPPPAANPAASKAASGDLNAARKATAKFRNLKAAKAAGYPKDATGCVDFPKGIGPLGPGGMGHHYPNGSLVNDGGKLDVTKPEVLVYQKAKNGSFRLVALEYMVPVSAVPSTGPAPVIFGQKMTFSAELRAWALHAWLFRKNPYGMFAPINPKSRCQPR